MQVIPLCYNVHPRQIQEKKVVQSKYCCYYLGHSKYLKIHHIKLLGYSSRVGGTPTTTIGFMLPELLAEL